nr:MAG TPA: hypothetical protein [Caudoviricetes sp.]
MVVIFIVEIQAGHPVNSHLRIRFHQPTHIQQLRYAMAATVPD